jgi:glucosamine--fructose-6-phosphate aminotransferase (isomerizing)
VLTEVAAQLVPIMHTFQEILGSGDYDGQLEARTAIRLMEVFRDLGCDRPVEEYQRRTGRVGSPTALLDELLARLTAAIEELTRPIDAIKHQAKTVTVGISRSDEGVLESLLVRAVLSAGAGRDVLSYRSLKVLADLDPAVSEVVGFIRYRVDGSQIEVIDRGGIARDLTSRVERSNVLVGTKRRVADEREVLVARGRSDQRTVIMIPEVKGGDCTGITLLHLRFKDRIEAAEVRGVLQGYDRRYDRLVDWVTETEGSFDDARLADVSVVDLLIRPISEMADLWLHK